MWFAVVGALGCVTLAYGWGSGASVAQGRDCVEVIDETKKREKPKPLSSGEVSYADFLAFMRASAESFVGCMRDCVEVAVPPNS